MLHHSLIIGKRVCIKLCYMFEISRKLFISSEDYREAFTYFAIQFDKEYIE